MKFYKVVSSHWQGTMEFKSELNFEMGQCFRITAHDGYKSYPTRLRVVGISDTPEYSGDIVTILKADTEVEAF